MIVIDKDQVYSDKDLNIRRKNSDILFKKGFILNNDTVDDYEEVDQSSNVELILSIQHKLNELYEYDSSSNVNSFTLDDNTLWLDKSTRVGLMNSIQIEKQLGKSTTILWYGEISFVIPVDLAINLLQQLEMYALQCYNCTAIHAQNIKLCETVESVNAYDFTKNYPDKLILKTTVE